MQAVLPTVIKAGQNVHSFPRLGELLSNMKLYPYMDKGVALDLDTCKEPGFYGVMPERTSNIPSGYFRYGILTVKRNVLTGYIMQTYFPVVNSISFEKKGIAVRGLSEGSWTAWNYIPYSL